MELPRILIIDDQLGQFNSEQNERLRRTFCRQRGILDISRDPKKLDDIEETVGKVAAAVFCSGQIIEDKKAINSHDVVQKAIKSGWPSADGWRWALVMLDLRFKQGSLDADGNAVGLPDDISPDNFFGLDVLRELRKNPEYKHLPIIILTGTEKALSGLKTTRIGIEAFEDRELLSKKRLSELLDEHGLIPDETGSIIGNSIELLVCLREARNRAKKDNENILIVGEVGTGKELLAKYIHRHSGRDPKRYYPLLMSALADSLIDSQLHGHKKGVFTGALKDQPGIFELVDKGTLFIDEFGTVHRDMLPKMMRFLQTDIREIQPIGSVPKKVNVLVVMATNSSELIDAKGEVRDSILSRAKFRQAIVLPPLRKRPEDIPKLVELFLKNADVKTEIKVVSDVFGKLQSHSWPENIRDLHNEIEAAIQKGKGTGFIVPEFFDFGHEKQDTNEGDDNSDKNKSKNDDEEKPKDVSPPHYGSFYHAYKELARNLKDTLTRLSPFYAKRNGLGQIVSSDDPVDHYHLTRFVNDLYATKLKTKPAREQLAYDLALIKTFFPEFVNDPAFRVFYQHLPKNESEERQKNNFIGYRIQAAEKHFSHIPQPDQENENQE